MSGVSRAWGVAWSGPGVPAQQPAGDRPTLPPQLEAGRIVAIARGLAADRLAGAVDALVDGGVRALEITLDSPDALDAIADAVARHAGSSEVAVGAGTVRSTEAAQAAVDAGASFLVAPDTDLAVVGWAWDHDVPLLPGALTPTEITTAWRAGAAAVKVFPAEVFGPAFLAAVRSPLAGIPLVPTGGVTADTAAAFLEAGALAVGAGGWLMGDGEPDGVNARARALVAAVAPFTTPGERAPDA